MSVVLRFNPEINGNEGAEITAATPSIYVGTANYSNISSATL